MMLLFSVLANWDFSEKKREETHVTQSAVGVYFNINSIKPFLIQKQSS